MDTYAPLLSIAVDLTASLAASDRLSRLLDAVLRAIPCDAAAVLRLVGDELVPVATQGLAPEVLGPRFPRTEHPRLDIAVDRGAPVRFAADSPLLDPYDGLLWVNPDATRHVRACLGLPLMEADDVIGLLTADALETGSFDALDDDLLRMLGALAGAALRTGRLFEALERASSRHRQVARVMQRDAAVRADGGRNVRARAHRAGSPVQWGACLCARDILCSAVRPMKRIRLGSTSTRRHLRSDLCASCTPRIGILVPPLGQPLASMSKSGS